MIFKTFAPDERLKMYVKDFWYAEGSDKGAMDVMADGFHGIIFQITENGLFIERPNKKLPTLFLYGQTVNPVTMKMSGNYRMVGASLYPYITKPIFGFNTNEITDSCLDLSLVEKQHSKLAIDQWLHATSIDSHINVLREFVIQLLERDKLNINQKIFVAINKMIASNGGLSLKKLQDTLNMTERTFERVFDQYVGISPKLFSRICQFNSSYVQFISGKYTKLSDVATDNGYADQSHFIRSFKEFAGYSPLEFQRLPYKSVENMPVLLK